MKSGTSGRARHTFELFAHHAENRFAILMALFDGTPLERPLKCERCGELEVDCQCKPERLPRLPPEKQTARLQVEKRKRGKLVTVVRGLSATDSDLPNLLKRLKDECGAGGTLKDNVIEIQGDQQERVRQSLRQTGYRVKG